MRNRKSTWNWFKFYDTEGIARHLEKQAEKGWMLTDLTADRMYFHRQDTQTVRYCVVFLPKPEDTTPAVWDRDHEFLEFCAHDGWELVCEDAYKRVFRNTRPDPVPIYSDSETELENIHRSSMRHVKLQVGMIVLTVLHLLMLCFSVSATFSRTLADNNGLLFRLAYISINLFLAEPVLTYLFWHRRAKQAVSESIPIRQISCGRNYCHWLSVPFLIMVVLLTDTSFLTFLVGILFPIVVLIMLANKPEKGESKTREFKSVLMLVVGLFFGFVMMSMVMAGIVTQTLELRNSVNNSIIGRALGWEDLEQPLYPEDYLSGFVPVEEGSWESDASLFVENHTLQQEVTVDGESCNIRYSVVKVKLDAFYSHCLEDLLDYSENTTFIPIDPAVCGADSAYRLTNSDGPLNIWLLCYDGILVEFRPGCELTEDQMRICGEKFLSCVD